MDAELRIPPAGPVCPGVDCSFYQRDTNWDEVASGGIVFAFIKATEGVTYVNPLFSRDASASKSAGILRSAYHFYHPEKDPVAQADNFIRTVNAAAAMQLPPMFDWEISQGINAALQVSRALTILDKMETEFNQIPIIYTRQNFFDDLSKLSDTKQFSRYPLFISDWHTHAPRIPDVWASAGWKFWQGSNCGVVMGFQKPLDTDVFNGSRQDLLEFAST